MYLYCMSTSRTLLMAYVHAIWLEGSVLTQPPCWTFPTPPTLQMLALVKSSFRETLSVCDSGDSLSPCMYTCLSHASHAKRRGEIPARLVCTLPPVGFCTSDESLTESVLKAARRGKEPYLYLRSLRVLQSHHEQICFCNHLSFHIPGCAGPFS